MSSLMNASESLAQDLISRVAIRGVKPAVADLVQSGVDVELLKEIIRRIEHFGMKDMLAWKPVSEWFSTSTITHGCVPYQMYYNELRGIHRFTKVNLVFEAGMRRRGRMHGDGGYTQFGTDVVWLKLPENEVDKYLSSRGGKFEPTGVRRAEMSVFYLDHLPEAEWLLWTNYPHNRYVVSPSVDSLLRDIATILETSDLELCETRTHRFTPFGSPAIALIEGMMELASETSRKLTEKAQHISKRTDDLQDLIERFNLS